jgi:hypothetical protein
MLINGGQHTAGARLHDVEADTAGIDLFPGILGIWIAAVNHDVRPKAVHRNWRFSARGQPLVQVGKAATGNEKQRVAVGKSELPRYVGMRRTRRPFKTVCHPHQSHRHPQEPRQPCRRLVPFIYALAGIFPYRHVAQPPALIPGRYAQRRHAVGDQNQAAPVNIRPDQRELRDLALRDERPRCVDQHPFAVMARPANADLDLLVADARA